ncbi:NUDIX hydrolase [Microlunatus speluncae]|uniref:NUDIX hydrolase n=1 Tax=Microlunatus speluncae TaxID=2594267 RepID=UPI001375A7EA|nr:NUDIX domain-containing protein [Microlunatus speluncae]
MPDSAEAPAHQIQRIGAYAVCTNVDGSILLSRYTSGTWGLPGGGVEHGEHPEDTVVREVAEETGYTARVRDLIGIHSNEWTTNSGHDIHSVNVVYRVELLGGELRHESDGTSDLADWIPITEVGNHPHTPLIDVVLQQDREPRLQSGARLTNAGSADNADSDGNHHSRLGLGPGLPPSRS